jgi:flagellar hook-basal body complex protein FliE
MIEGIGGKPLELRLPSELPVRPGGAGGPGASGQASRPAPSGFGRTIATFLGEVNDLQLRSDAELQSFVRGETADLHQVVLAQQEAAIALRLVVEMRDRLLQAYQDVMRMTV